MRKRGAWRLMATFGVLAVLLAACSQVPTATIPMNTDGYIGVSGGQLPDMLRERDRVLVDTHVPYEGELPQTDQFIPFVDVAGHLDKLPY